MEVWTHTNGHYSGAKTLRILILNMTKCCYYYYNQPTTNNSQTTDSVISLEITGCKKIENNSRIIGWIYVYYGLRTINQPL